MILSLATVLAGTTEDDGSRNPGPVPLLIVVLLAIVTVLLIRNMSGRIKRLPPSFPDPSDDRSADVTGEDPPTPRDERDGSA